MSDVATASAGQAVVGPATDATKGKTAAASKKKAAAAGGKSAKKHVAEHPKYSEMVSQALSSLKERGGSSRQAVLKYIMKNFNVGNDENAVNTHLKIALRAGVKNATLKQSKGSGATGSFRLGEEAKKKPKAAAANKTTKKAKAPAKIGKTKTAAGDKKSVKSPKKKMTKKATTKSASASKAASTKPSADKPKKAAGAVKKVKADKPKKSSSSPSKVVKKPVAKKTPVAKKATKPAAAKKA
jgi:hypothetical protein